MQSESGSSTTLVAQRGDWRSALGPGLLAAAAIGVSHLVQSTRAGADLMLGALVMFGTGTHFSDHGAVFADQLIALYTSSLGTWAYPIIAACAFTAMFSTLLTVLDAHPRVCRHMAAQFTGREQIADSVGLYRLPLVVIPLCSLAVLYGLGEHFRLMIDLATTLSFLTAPVLAWLNYRLVTAEHVPLDCRPGTAMRWPSRAGIVFLTVFALLYAY